MADFSFYMRLPYHLAETLLRSYFELIAQLSELTRATVGLGLKFHMRIELGAGSPVPEETIARVNALLAEVSEKLRLQRE